MLAIWRGLFALAGLIVATGIVGCTGLSSATPSVEGPVISEPLAALVTVRADPPTAEQAVTIRLYRLSPDSGPGFQFRFEAGERIAAEEGGLPGPYKVAVNDMECSGTVNLVAELETDLLITRDPAGGCTISGAGVHVPAGADSGSALITLVAPSP